MEMSLGFKPFNIFWINCVFNTLFSILISRESSYYYAALLNDYSYDVYDAQTPNGTKFNGLSLTPIVKYRDKYKDLLYSENKPVNFKCGDNYFDILKGYIIENKIIAVGVDLFYWIPESVCWNKHHWMHYSYINGFSDEKRAVYVFDENVHGFNEFEIPEDRLIKAISNFPHEPSASIYKLSENIEKFELSISEIKDNAKRIIDEINKIIPVNFWELSEKDFAEYHMCDRISTRIFQIINRHIANQLLMQELKDEFLSPKIRSSLIKYCEELQEGWSLVKNKLVRTYFSEYQESAVCDINEKCKRLLSKEIDMWNTVIKYAG